MKLYHFDSNIKWPIKTIHFKFTKRQNIFVSTDYLRRVCNKGNHEHGGGERF